MAAENNATIQLARSQTEQRAIKLLGSGLPASVVANAIGVSESRISQLMAQKDFADEVNNLKFQNLQKHNEMDEMYDAMEKRVANNLNEMIPLITRPGELLKAAQVLNQMKRRGMSSPENTVSQNQVVQLLMPVSISQKFTTNINNQVIQAGNQILQTVQGSSLLSAAKSKQSALSQQAPGYLSSNTIDINQNEITINPTSENTNPTRSQ